MIRKTKWAIQRLFRGYAECDLWNLDLLFVRKFRAPLKAFIRHQEEKGMSLPLEFETDPTGWLLTLAKIEFAFDEVFADDLDKGFVHKDETQEEFSERQEKIQEGFELFGKYFRNLWD